MPDTREKCYEEIRACLTSRMLDYYKRHKDILGDPRSQDALKESRDGLNCIFQVLDNYDISRPKAPRG